MTMPRVSQELLEIAHRIASAENRVSTYLEPLHEHRHAVTGPELMNLMRQQAENF